MARIVFDLDGTLIDSAPDIQMGVNLMLADEGIAPLSLEQVKSFIGNGLPHLVRLVIGATPLRIEDHARHLKQVLAHYDAVNGDQTRPYPGVVDRLDALKAAGHRLAVCTNKPEAPARDIGAKRGLTQCEAVIGGDSLPERKPDPAPLNAAFEGLGEGPEIYVGDSEVDAETAHRAAVPFLLFTEGYHKRPLDEMPQSGRFAHFDDLSDLIDSLLAAAE